MMVENKIYEMIMAKAKTKKDISEILDDNDLVFDLGLDSLSLVELIVDIESEFDIEIGEEEIEEVYKYGRLIKYVEKKVAEANN